MRAIRRCVAVMLVVTVPIPVLAQVARQPAPRDRKSLACEETLKRYTNDGCEKKCTSACKRRGTALLKCSLPPTQPINCADR
jgi:hypothetical protein